MRNCLPPLWNPLFISTPGSELGLAVNLPSALWPGLAASSPTTWHATGSRRLRRLLNSSALLLEMMVLCTTKKAALTLFACFFKLCLPLGMPTLEFGCFARVPGMAEGGVCLYARHCQLRALQQFDSVVREAYSSITGLHHTPSALLQRPLGSISEFIFKFYPPTASIHRSSVLILTSSLTSTPLASTHRPSVSFNASSLNPPPRPASQTFSLNLWFPWVWKPARYSSVLGGFAFGCHSGDAGIHLFGIHLRFYHIFWWPIISCERVSPAQVKLEFYLDFLTIDHVFVRKGCSSKSKSAITSFFDDRSSSRLQGFMFRDSSPAPHSA